MIRVARHAICFIAFLSFLELFGAQSRANADKQIITESGSNKHFAEVIHKLQKYPVIRSRFKQSKHIKILTKPLISDGRCIVSSEKGVIWNIREPVESSFLINAQGVFESINGKKRIFLDARKVPMAMVFITAFNSILNGSILSLLDYCKIAFSGKPHDWTIELTPEKGVLGKVFAKITLKGDDWIKEMVLLENNGNITRFNFYDTVTGQLLTKQEKTIFEY